MKTLKSEIRKEIKKELFSNVTKNPLTFEEFKMYVSQVYYIDDTQTLFKNQRRSSVSNSIIRNDPTYPEIVKLRRIENSSEGDKTKIAKLIKEALVNQLNIGFKLRGEETRVDIKTVEAYVNDITNRKYDEDKSAQLFEMFEVDRLRDIEAYLNTMSIFEWCKSVKGLGTKLTAKIIAGIGDIRRFPNPASLWSYCGVGDAEKSKRKKGQQLSHSPKMRSTLFNLGESFIKAGSQYRVIYDKRKERTLITHPEWHNLNPDGTPNTGKNMHPKHAHNDAARVMTKRFLAELFAAWYQSLGMEPPAKPYGVEIKGHHEDPMIVPFVDKRHLIEIEIEDDE